MSSKKLQSLHTNPVIILFVSLLNFTFTTTTTYGGNETDIQALLAIKANLQDPLGVLNSWNDSVHFCRWQGITCGRRHSRVTALNLRSSNLVGPLSPYIGNLTFLRQISLQNNTLQGQIPHQLGRLHRLQSLLLVNNSFEGEIPANLSNCRSLGRFNLGNNRLVGEIPIELGTLTKLTYFSVAGNNLSGEIPSSIGNLTSLQILGLEVNVLEGSIPNTLGELKNLTGLAIGWNKLTGIIPSSIFNLSMLVFFSSSVNQLEGTLPQNLGSNFPRLQLLDMWQNNFTGTIPLFLSNASELESIDLSNNNLVGKVPTNFGNLKHLQRLSLGNNALGSGDPEDLAFVYSLTNCTELELLSVVYNQLGGILPNTIANLSPKLREFGVLYNQISGFVPLGFGNLSNLERLGVAYNQLERQIPNDIGRLRNLRTLHFAGNRFSGPIPFSLGNITFLSRVFLQENALEGTIPSSLGNCQNLLWLNFSQNNISGTIPRELFSASPLSMSLNLAHNKLVGPIPAEVGKLRNLVDLDLSGNELSGEIPAELSSCSSLLNLFLMNNFFQGPIPPSFVSLRGVQNLDLSSNNLSGEVPIFLENFALDNLNLSFNNFEGELPAKGIFANTSVISVLGNNRLCGGVSELQLPKCDTATSSKKGLSNLHIILISIGCLVLFVSITSVFIFCWLKKKRRVKSLGISLDKTPLLKVSYGDLFKATDGFSSTNLIGTGGFGSVYKGILDRENQTIVAIKVLNLEQQGASKSFLAECEALRNIRHRNLVKLVTSCSSIDFQGNEFKALVYEFMPNGSLERRLHSADETQTLDLRQRIDIAVDVACALDYLHHHCGNPILHCDLKPNNVLLDKDMVARLGDFGLARFLLPQPNSANQSKTIGIKGTIGYVAPEYGLGSKVSMNGDIYSYGILLLEMITGRSPVDPMFDEHLNLHNFVKKALPDHVMEIVEPKLLIDDEEEVEHEEFNNKKSSKQSLNGDMKEDCLIAMVKIGVACSMESPHERMDIDDVIHDLHLARDILEGT